MGRIVAITGASAGVGRATAIEFARRGASVGLIARGEEGLAGAAADVRQAGGQAHTVSCDVADPAALEAAADDIEEALGPLDVWVNNAMVTVYGPFSEIEPEEFRRVVDVTFLGSVWGTRTALERMRPRGRGTILQVGSALGERGIPLQSAYCAAKHALNGFLDSVRTELLHEDSPVHLGIVQLPAINTPQFRWGRSRLKAHPQPMPPIYQPEVAARAILDAVDARRRETWVGYSTVGTILGNRVASRALDTYLARNAVSAQQTDEIERREEADNLFEPVPGDHGAHGPFDDRARDSSPYAEARRHPGVVAAAGAALIGLAGAAWQLARGGDGAPS